MTTTTHVYSAAVGATQLAVKGGTISLDSQRAPHVQATLTLRLNPATLTALDPRTSPAPRVSVTCSAGIPRTFNLHVRDLDVNQRDATMTLVLASDEALLSDWAPMAADTTPYTYQDSVRLLVNYVLGKAIPASTPIANGPNPAIRALISSVNLIRNPRAKTDLTDWSSAQSISRQTSGGPAGAATWVNCQSGSVGQLLVNYSSAGVPIQAGRRYRVSVWQNAASGVSLAFDALIQDAAGATLLDLVEVPYAATGGWVRRFLVFTAPANATKMQLRSFTTGSVAAGTSLNTTGWRVSEYNDDATDTGYFDGDTTSTSEYAYAYSGSTSTRTALVDRASDLLTWRAGTSALAFLAPILQALGLRLVCDETRTWTLRNSDYVTAGTLAVRVGVNMVEGSDTITRADSEWCDAAVVIYRWRDLSGVQQERIDSFALTATPSQVRLVERDTPYPGPGFAEYLVRRAQGRGRQVTVTAVSRWEAQAEQYSEYTLVGAPVQVGIISRVEFDLSNDEMTVTSRTADTVPGAIDLLTGVIDALTGVIDAL